MHEEHQQTLKRRRVHSNDMIKDEKGNVSGEGESECELAQKVDANYTEAEVDDCNNNNNNNRELTEGDVYTQLALRESDLTLAKEVGEALLAENVELREKYEGLLELHSSQVEDLQQEKHDLKVKCKRVESLQEEKVRELTNDLENLQNKLQTFQADSRDDRRTKREHTMELIDENARLASELTTVNDSNKELLSEISKLQKMQQSRSRIESCNDSEARETDALREKLAILEQEREFLDTSINELVTDKQEFGKEVNRLTKKVISLTEELADSKSELSLCEEELNSSKKENIKLHDQLDEFKLQTSQHVALNGSSIFSEISMLESECDFSMKLAESPSFKRLKTVASIQGTPKPLAASSSINLLRQQEDQLSVDDPSNTSLDESDDDGGEVMGGGSVLKQQGFFAQLEEEQRVNMELRKEMCTVCHKLLQACRFLTNDTYETKQTLEMDIDEHFLKDDAVTGTLTMIATEMVGLLKEYLESQQDESILTEENEQERLLDLEKQVEDLTIECFEAKKQLSSLGIQLSQSRKENSQKDEQMSQLLEMINNQQSEIESLKNRSVTNDKSQSVMEELEKAKTDVKDLDDQLLVAINQKIKLSEQLEQWQYDMASVIEDQVQKQLKNTANERDHAKRRNSRLPFMNKGWNWS